MGQAAAIVLAGLIMASAAQARLGETRKECIARYGEPVSDTPVFVTFHSAQFSMLIRFADDKAAYIQIWKHDGLKDAALSDQEVLLLLEANGGGKQWKARSRPSGEKVWITEDGERYAIYDDAKRHLTITMKAFVLQMSAPGGAK